MNANLSQLYAMFSDEHPNTMVYILHYMRVIQRKFKTMQTNKRYFDNYLPDYNGKLNTASNEDLKQRITTLLSRISNGVQPSEANADGGLYVGITGIGYLYHHLSKSALFSAIEKEQFIKTGVTYIQPAIQYAKKRANVKDELSSFILGNAGTFAIAAALAKTHDEQQQYITLFRECGTNCQPINFLRCGSDELFVGRAGYINASLWLETELNEKVIADEDMRGLCETIVTSGSIYSTTYKHPSPLMYAYYNTEYLGAAHGLSTILQTLLSVPTFLERPEHVDVIRRSVDYLLSVQFADGNFPCTAREVNCAMDDADELVHWCHGAPGIVYLMAKAYLLWKHDKYLQSCLKCGDLIWKKGLLRKGPGLCHGISGNAYVFLLLYRLTDDPKHLHRAHQFANFIDSVEFKTNARTPDTPFSLYEGLAGAVCFLADLGDPKRASFPFLNVF